MKILYKIKKSIYKTKNLHQTCLLHNNNKIICILHNKIPKKIKIQDHSANYQSNILTRQILFKIRNGSSN